MRQAAARLPNRGVRQWKRRVETRMLAGDVAGSARIGRRRTHTAIARGKADGCEAVQIFARPSAQWRAKPFLPEEVSLFRSEHATVGWPTLSHASYLINLAAGDPAILDKSRDALADEMFRAEELGLDFVVLHPGAHVGAGVGGWRRGGRRIAVRARCRVRAGCGCASCWRSPPARGAASAAASRRWRRCWRAPAAATGWDLLRHLPRARLWLRPQHRGGLRADLRAFARVIGLDKLRAFHLNDSKTPTGSHVDRHAEIGDGYLGLLPFWRLVNDARFAATPAVLETPSGPDGQSSFPATWRGCAAHRRAAAVGRAQVAGSAREGGPAPGAAVPEPDACNLARELCRGTRASERSPRLGAAASRRCHDQVRDDHDVRGPGGSTRPTRTWCAARGSRTGSGGGGHHHQPLTPGVTARQRPALDAAQRRVGRAARTPSRSGCGASA